MVGGVGNGKGRAGSTYCSELGEETFDGMFFEVGLACERMINMNNVQ